MKQYLATALVAATVAMGSLAAQQPAPAPAPAPQRQPGAPEGRSPAGGQMERRGGPAMFRLGVFSPTVLLERRSALNLSPEQVTRLSTLENEAKAARDKAQADATPHREELEKLMQQPTPDVAQIRTHAQALFQAQQAGQVAALTTAAQAKAVLTPEQRGRVQGWADARRHDGPRGGRGMQFRRRPAGDGNEMPRRPAGFGFRGGAGEL